jgi:sec-independent protein translocase protein TatA
MQAFLPMAMFGLGVPELLIILAVVLLLFGGSRLAGLGKSTGRALKEFKEETKGLKPEDKADQAQVAGSEPQAPPTPQTQSPQTFQQTPQNYQQPPAQTDPQVYQQPPSTPNQNPGGEIRKDG